MDMLEILREIVSCSMKQMILESEKQNGKES